jgi:hypothetical protein
VTDIASATEYAGTLKNQFNSGVLTVEEYDKKNAENSKIIMDSINKGLNNLKYMDFEALGFNRDEWNGMTDESKKLSVYMKLGEMSRDGIVTYDDYEDMLKNEVSEAFTGSDYKNSITPIMDAVDVALVIQDLYDDGLLRQNAYTDLLYNSIGTKIKNTNLFKEVKEAVKSFRETYGESEEVKAAHMKMYGVGNRLDDGSRSEWKDMTEEQQQLLVMMADFLLIEKGAVNKPKPTKGAPSTGVTQTYFDSGA